jgi:hypothetical protein
MADSNRERKFFDLHTNGIGYVNRIREVRPEAGRQGKPFLACTIMALRGAKESPAYTRFDVRVVGSKAQELIRQCEQAEQAGAKVLVNFRIGDPYGEIFTHEKGQKAGEEDVSIKGRLLFLNWVKVDQEFIFRTPPRNVQQQSEQAAPPVEAAA